MVVVQRARSAIGDARCARAMRLAPAAANRVQYLKSPKNGRLITNDALPPRVRTNGEKRIVHNAHRLVRSATNSSTVHDEEPSLLQHQYQPLSCHAPQHNSLLPKGNRSCHCQ